MKNKLILLVTAAALAASSVQAASVSFSNFNSGTFAGLVIVDSSGTSLGNTATAAVGFFSDEVAAAGGDFSSWTQLGDAANFGSAAVFSIAGLYSGAGNGAINIGDAFIGQNITTFITAGSEFLIAQSTATFAADAPAFLEDMNIFSDVGTTYLFGGLAGPLVDYGAGDQASIATAAVPEPSTYAALAGLVALGAVMVRRRRA